jgi:hypothetical protein
MPAFQSMLGSNGMLQNQYQIQNQLNTQGLDKLREIGLGTGPSAWAQARGQELNTQQGQGLQNAAAQNASAQAQAQSQLAQRGGISSGSRERLALQGQRQGFLGQQAQTLQGQNAQNALATEDQQRRTNVLEQLPGQEMGAEQTRRGAEQFNIQNALKENQAARDYEQSKYQAQMQAWAAQKQAEAIRANKSKGFLEQAGGLAGALGGGGVTGAFGF